MQFRALLLLSLVGLLALRGFSQVNFSTTNLPIVIIHTNSQSIGNDEPILADMGIIFNGPGITNTVTDPYNHYNGKVAIISQSVFSSTYPKKQYEIQLRNQVGNVIETPLLGMPAESEWVLMAMYHDRSLLRDVLAHRLNWWTGRYAPRFQFCEVMLNDEYMGVYVMIEKIKRGPNRIDLPAAGTTGNNLTGGYIIKVDRSGTSEEGWTSTFEPPASSADQTIYFQYVSPGVSEIGNQQKDYIRQFVQDFESALASSNFTSQGQGYARLIDMDSFVDFLLLNEVIKNPEAYRLNAYLYKQRQSAGNRLFMGPGWNYGFAFGNSESCLDNSVEGHALDFNTVCPDKSDLVPFWWKRFLDDGAFRQRVEARWEFVRNGVYSTTNILNYIDSLIQVLNQGAQQRNAERWPQSGSPTYQQEITQLKNWISHRLEWLDANMTRLVTSTEHEFSSRVQIFPNPFQHSFNLSFTSSRPGQSLLQLRDATGRQVLHSVIEVESAGTHEIEIESQHLQPGMYILHYEENGHRHIRKIVKTE